MRAALNGGANLIDGDWSRAPGSGTFELRAAMAPFGGLGSWPAADADAARQALESLSAECAPPDARAAARALAGDAETLELTGRRLGLTRDELATHVEVRHLAVDVPRPPMIAGPDEVALVARDWSELFEGPFRAACDELSRGRAVVLASDSRAPMLAEGVVRAFLAAGVPARRMALLHGLREQGLEALIAHPRLRGLSVSGDRGRIRWLRECTEGRLPDPRLDLLRSDRLEVRRAHDLPVRAREVVHRAFSRSATLSGQRPGSVTRVHCDERLLSRFTEALLDELGRSPAALDPLPMIDREAMQRLQRAWSAGLDEGATLIAGGGVFSEGAQPRPSELRAAPTVFTNVEPHMTLARRQAPLPIVCLLRTSFPSSPPARSPQGGGTGHTTG